MIYKNLVSDDFRIGPVDGVLLIIYRLNLSK